MERFEFTLPGGKKFELREIGAEDEIAALKTTNADMATALGRLSFQHELIRRSLISIDGVARTWSDLEAGKLFALFTPAEFKLVDAAVNKVNVVKKDDVDGFLSTLKLKS